MNNPNYLSPNNTTQTASAYKAALDASLAATGLDVINIGFTLSAGTFTIHGADGTALSSANPGFVRFQDPDNFGRTKYISVEANQNFIDDSGSSEIIGNLFGNSTGVADTADVVFMCYVVSNDAMTSVAFMLSRDLDANSSPAAANIGAPDDAVADATNDFFALDNLDETLFDSNPCTRVLKIRMRMSASDDWTVQTPDATDGVGKFDDAFGGDDLSAGIVVDAAGIVTMGSQPSFRAGGSVNNVTGNNTLYTLVLGTEAYDVSAEYSAGVFTPTVPGKYLLGCNITMWNAAGGSEYLLLIVTSNNTYELEQSADVTSGGYHHFKAVVIADMDASDTAVVKVRINGIGADTADITTSQFFGHKLS
jgi:hypothetical protein